MELELEYFTSKGANQVIEKFTNLISNEFYFNDSVIKQKLVNIAKQKSTEKGFIVIFQGEQGGFMPIYKFMPRNGIDYNFYDFDIIMLNI